MAGTIATDEERRAIAARIRERGLSECADMAYALGNGCKVGARCEDCRDWMAERLASLVEPQADADALRALADRVERLSSDPSRCGSEACAYFGHPDCDCDGCAAYSSDEPCIDLAAKDAASRIRDAIGGGETDEWICLGGRGTLKFSSGPVRSMAEWEDALNGPGSTLDVGTIYAVDEDSYDAVKNRRLELCSALGLSIETLWSEAMAELSKRLMPEGMEWLVEAWPRFEDDAPLKFGDMALIDGEADMVEAVQLWIHGKPVIYGDGGSQQLERGERVKRPALKVLGPDGVEIRVGDTVWDTETGEEMRVVGLEDGHVITDSPTWGDTLITPSVLTHERPDSWERLEEDCSMNTGAYARERMGIDVDKVPAQESRRIDMMRDLVRRAKALAGVSER